MHFCAIGFSKYVINNHSRKRLRGSAKNSTGIHNVKSHCYIFFGNKSALHLFLFFLLNNLQMYTKKRRKNSDVFVYVVLLKSVSKNMS